MEPTSERVDENPRAHKNISHLLGVRIETPHEVYPSQRVMMAKIIRALKCKQNCVIESPTGTGKTAALLCSVLAWRAKSIELGGPYTAGSTFGPDRGSPDGQMSRVGPSDVTGKSTDPLPKRVRLDNKNPSDIPCIYYATRTHNQIRQVIAELNTTIYCKDLKSCTLSSRRRSCLNESVRDLTIGCSERCFQLAENYRARFTSRSEDNANKYVASRQTDICPYYRDAGQMKHIFSSLQEGSTCRVWDIEDACTYGREKRICPFFGTRSIQGQADITFCPYNYILDPAIRKSLDINLSGAILIFDEAHNIEDACRDSASFSATDIDIRQQLSVLDRLIDNGRPQVQDHGGINVLDRRYYEALVHFKAVLSTLLQASEELSTDPVNNNAEFPRERVLGSEELANFLHRCKLDRDCGPELKKHTEALAKGCCCYSDKRESAVHGLSDDHASESTLHTVRSLVPVAGGSMNRTRNVVGTKNDSFILIERLIHCLTMIHTSSDRYKLVVRREIIDRRYGNTGSANCCTTTLRDCGVIYGKPVIRLHFMCMDPGMIFSKVANLAWSVIVSSGTLAPIRMFCQEVDCEFQNIFEGSHVVDERHCYLSLFNVGPTGVDLDGSYKNASSADYAKEVGRVVVDICMGTNKGVLCFVTSYERLNFLYRAWDTNGFLDDIMRSGKRIYIEQKSMDHKDITSMVQSYGNHAMCTGAILFAVHRGKVSEGVNFSNDLARAVISIGIPFSSMKDTQVKLKKEFNDTRVSPQNGMSANGRDWYECQALRPLFQAIGRCIRHRNDWGAIVIIDSRFSKREFRDKIPRWLRRKFDACSLPLAKVTYDEATRRFASFMQRMGALAMQ